MAIASPSQPILFCFASVIAGAVPWVVGVGILRLDSVASGCFIVFAQTLVMPTLVVAAWLALARRWPSRKASSAGIIALSLWLTPVVSLALSTPYDVKITVKPLDSVPFLLLAPLSLSVYMVNTIGLVVALFVLFLLGLRAVSAARVGA